MRPIGRAYWASRRLDGQLDARWMVNPTRNKEPVGEALRLLEDRVIDAMIAETRQRPADDDPKFVCFDLYETPLWAPRIISKSQRFCRHEKAAKEATEKDNAISSIGKIS